MNNQVAILIVSHSYSLAKGVKEIGKMISSDVVIEDVGGIDEFTLGTNYDLIKEKILNIYSSSGILILTDMGSSTMTSQMVIEELGLDNIIIADCPLVEGVVKAVMDITQGKKLAEIKLDWQTCILHKN